MKDKYMSNEMFGELVESMKQAAAISRREREPSRVFAYSPINVREIRERARKSQVDFARMIGVKVGTLRNWEQGRRKPNGTALTLLKVVAADPEYVESVLQM